MGYGLKIEIKNKNLAYIYGRVLVKNETCLEHKTIKLWCLLYPVDHISDLGKGKHTKLEC